MTKTDVQTLAEKYGMEIVRHYITREGRGVRCESENAIRRFGHGRKRCPEQKPRQEPGDLAHFLQHLTQHGASQLKSIRFGDPRGTSNVRGTFLAVTHNLPRR